MFKQFKQKAGFAKAEAAVVPEPVAEPEPEPEPEPEVKEKKKRKKKKKHRDELPPGWEEAVDEATGDAYYVNAATGETSWERPSGASGAAGHAVVAAEGGLPPGWEEVFDEDSGGYFYFNAATSESTWDRPAWGDTTEADEVGYACSRALSRGAGVF